MIYSEFKGKKLSYFGLGAMRLPKNEDQTIDVKQLEQMVDYAIEHGVNYFDTAYTYHGSTSEIELGKALNRHPRESFYLCDKYPGHQKSGLVNPPAMFQKQLDKCGVEYFDFYLLHNVCEATFDDYMDEELGIARTCMEEREKGRIKHLGFSTHGDIPMLKAFLEKYGSEMEFCLLQINYMDWSLQRAKEKYELVSSYNIPIWVMEPIRGGKLVVNGVDKALRWLEGLDNVKVVLNGVSNLEQLKENIAILDERRPLTEEETEELYRKAEEMRNDVPCTNCNYCEGCPLGLDIPKFIEILNNNRVAFALNQAMNIEVLPENKRPGACISCGKCIAKCPQKIDIPAVLKELDERFQTMPKWADFLNEHK